MAKTPKIRFLSVFCLAMALSIPLISVKAQNDMEQGFHIDKNGNVVMNQAKVMQIAGSSFYMRYYIGLAFIRVLVKTDAGTKVYRRFGDEIQMSQIAAGDTVNVEGKIETGADSLSLIASKLVDLSNQKEVTGFKGVIIGTGSTTGSFVLKAKNQNILTIVTGTTTQIRKGNRILTPDQVRNGDIITDTTGTYDHGTNALDANIIVIYADMSVYKERNFEGVLKALSLEKPQTLTVSVKNKDYAVILSENAEILNKKRNAVSIQRFVVGDTVRFFGNIRETDEPIIDAQIIRNLNL